MTCHTIGCAREPSVELRPGRAFCTTCAAAHIRTLERVLALQHRAHEALLDGQAALLELNAADRAPDPTP